MSNPFNPQRFHFGIRSLLVATLVSALGALVFRFVHEHIEKTLALTFVLAPVVVLGMAVFVAVAPLFHKLHRWLQWKGISR